MGNRRIESLIAVAAFGLLALGSGESSSGGSGGEPSRAPASTSLQAPAPELNMPKDERDFCSILAQGATDYANAHNAGANELKLSALRASRGSALGKSVRRGIVKEWIGSIERMSTTGEGKAAIEVKLPCGVHVGTWNNSLSDIGSGTLIAQSSPLYTAFADLQQGTMIKFSGNLATDPANGFHEKSMTEQGSMTDPSFVIAFTGVWKL